MMRRTLTTIFALLPALAAAQGSATGTTYANRISVGSGVPGTAPSGSSTRLSGLGSSGGTTVLLKDGGDNIIARVLAKTDLPSTVAYEDEGNIFTAGQQIWRSTVSETASGADEVRIGVLSGTPRILFEDSGFTQWELDNTGGALRVFTPGAERFRFATDAFTPGLNQGYSKDLGTFLNKFRSIYGAELRIETLVAASVRSTIGGKTIVAPTTELTVDLAAAGTTISVKHNEIANGDRLWLEGNGQLEFMAVTSGPSGSGPYTYTVTRNLDGSGANDWPAGSAVVNTGTTGDGFIEAYADSSLGGLLGPTIRGVVRTGTTYNNLADRWAIGNLNGLYGYGATTYGAAFGNPSGTNVTIDDTNGVRIRTGGTTTKFQADTSGNVTLTGDLVGTGWRIRNSDGINLLTGTLSGGQSRQIWFSSTLGGTQLGTLYDDGELTLYRSGGATVVQNNSAIVRLQAGGASVERVHLSLVDDAANAAAYAELDGSSPGYTLALRPGVTDSYDVGTSSLRWKDIWFSEPTTSAALFPLVTNSGRIMAKNNGLNGTTTCSGGQRVSAITAQFGIVTAITCS